MCVHLVVPTFLRLGHQPFQSPRIESFLQFSAMQKRAQINSSLVVSLQLLSLQHQDI
jgi:hypothetical protein